MQNRNRSYDESKDKALVKDKVKIDADNVWMIGLKSYDGGEPKLQVQRWYRGRDGEWHYPKKPDARIPWVVVVAIVAMSSKLEKAYEEWKAANKGRKTEEKDADGDDIPF